MTKKMLLLQISIHASAKEATTFYLGEPTSASDFNPRLREGGDENVVLKHQLARISIHASAKEATIIINNIGLVQKISIHASAKEATATYCNTPAIMCISSLNNFFVHHF